MPVVVCSADERCALWLTEWVCKRVIAEAVSGSNITDRDPEIKADADAQISCFSTNARACRSI